MLPDGKRGIATFIARSEFLKGQPPLRDRLAAASMSAKGHHMTSRRQFRRSAMLATALLGLAAFAALRRRAPTAATISPPSSRARSTACGSAAPPPASIYLSHPQAKRTLARLLGGRISAISCSPRPTAASRTPAFLDLVASAAAIIFTLPKDDMLKGVTRCVKRMGLFHGDDVSIRYRRLDMRCTRTKTEASITISRSLDQ